MSSSSDFISLENIITPPTDEEMKENLSMIIDRYKDRVSTLPKGEGGQTDHMYNYQGFWYPQWYAFAVETVMALQENFQAKPTDIYLTSHPKSGTTWLKALAFAIMNRSMFKPDSRHHPLLTNNPHQCVPFLEIEICRSTPLYAAGHTPRLFATHIPYSSLPQSILDSGCRIVYVYRNPKDVLVSRFHFINMLREKLSRPPLTFDQAFELFRKGVVSHGPCWDHVVGYRMASLEKDANILFLKYEEMKKDAHEMVKKLAEFLGYPLVEEETVEDIVKLCSFKKLSEVNKDITLGGDVKGDIYFRKGEVGDAINYLTPQMVKDLDQVTQEKFKDLDLSF